MNDTTTPDAALRSDDVPEQRSCTRCDGQQHLTGAHHGMGKYRCDTCEMVVGFDTESSTPEFLIDRGLPSRYTKDVFGDLLARAERRITPRSPELAASD